MKQTAINAVRFLAVDAINKANSGHPGICLGAAPALTELYSEHMKVSNLHPDWVNRDPVCGTRRSDALRVTAFGEFRSLHGRSQKIASIGQ